ncbi:Putative ABC transporter substrate-binding protein YesO [Blautia producta]|uniref:ABC transporter substrate-binding protein YesO n=2 Tax=Blautia producta TaxID=33035 RepID=A0A4P6LXU4_9FIRM|nr:Putative ABC transporter substrate-binding protein YesO [Blautia producta]
MGDAGKEKIMKKSRIKRLLALAISGFMIIGLGACGNGGNTEEETKTGDEVKQEEATTDNDSTKNTQDSEEEVTIRYALWDMNQQPAYEQICKNFEAENPGVKVQIELIPWADYWTKLTTQASSGSCPDLMNMFILQFKTLQSKGVLADLTPYIEADNMDLSKYNQTALDAFTVDGKIYGIPKDFDAIATFYNKDMLKAAGYEEYPQGLTWNPDDGGTYVKFLQDLTLDANGLHPYDDGFDSSNVVQYGLLPIDRTDYSADGIISTTIKQMGGEMYDPETCAFTLSDEKSSQAMEFLWKLTNEWFVAPPVDVIKSTGAEAVFYSQTAATWLNGPWMTSAISENCAFEFGITRNFVGPGGESVSRANSLVDCVYEKSQHKDIAWKLAEYIATAPGQTVLGETGTVIPAHLDYGQTYVDYYKEKGFDVQVFLDAYNGQVVFPPSMIEFPRADDVIMRQMSLALDGKGDVRMADIIASIEEEINGFLVEANK